MKAQTIFIESFRDRTRLAVIIITLLLSALSFSLPREFFDPHTGVRYDIFCQLTHYISAVVLDFYVIEYPGRKLVLIQCVIYTASTIIILILFRNLSRPPPVPRSCTAAAA